MSNSNVATMPDKWRQRLHDANIMGRLLKHFKGELEIPLDNGQITIGIKLLGKILPDLQSTTMDVNVNHSAMNIHELNARLSSLGYDPQAVMNQLNGTVIESEPVDKPVSISVDKSDSVSE